MYRTLQYALLFLVAALLQIFLFNNLSLSVYLNPLVYVVFIALLPMETTPIRMLLAGLAMGLAMDWTMGAAGVNTIATVFVAFVRIHLLNFVCGTAAGRKVLHGLPRPDGRPPQRDLLLHGGALVVARAADAAAARRERRGRRLLLLADRTGIHLPTLAAHMTDSRKGYVRMRTLQAVVLLIFGVIILRLAYIQLIDPKYEKLARGNALRHVVQYPPRGEIFDRNGEYLAQNRACYDLMVIYRELPREGFDTLQMLDLLGISRTKLERALRNARMSPRIPYMVTNFISSEVKLRFDENNFPGFYTVYRTIRSYPRKIGGNLLGDVGEINAAQLKRNPRYRAGDYIGQSGVEKAYEEVLRGKNGVKINEINTHGVVKGSYMDGMFDSLPEPGSYIVTTIDARLQAFTEELMRGKVGAAVAIEPSTGEILMMVSSPTFDPDEMVGRHRGNNYMKMLYNKRQPMFNRAVKAKYPPGSTFKLVQGLIGLQEGVLTPADRYSCNGGFRYGHRMMKCHAHASPLDLRGAVANSCNAYFCYVLRNILENRRYEDVEHGFDMWKTYVNSLGFGRKLESDFLDEGAGYVPSSEYYDRVYHGSWNALTVISLSIGQGELGCTPLQMANFAAILANRGYYYIPHIVKRIEGRDSIDRRFYEKQYTMIDPKHFEPIVEGMWRGVNVGGTSTVARLDGWDVCGKTGTAQNPQGRDHSTFLSFAPKDNPRIAISVYVENGGFGATIALPIASLVEEYYLTDTITRPWLVDRVKNMQIYYPSYAK